MGVPEREQVQPKRKSKARWLLHLFPLPAFILYTLFVVYPILSAFTYSMYEWKGIARGAFVGLQNFLTLFQVEPFNKLFWNAFGHNVIYFLVEMVVQNGIAFILAFLIYRKIRGAGFLKIAYFMPRLLSVIVVGFLWKLILNPNYGALNTFLAKLGLEEWAKPWLGDPDTALLAIILVNCWFGIGFAVLIFLAGLQSIPEELIEAARLDGAKGITMLGRIILPLMMPSITIMTIFTFIQAFEAFELVYAMQGSMGEPFHSTDTLAVYFYRLAFSGSGGAGDVSIGLGSALAVVLFFIVASVSALSLRVMRKREIQH
ncbi:MULTISPECIES: carbohydrate ABC transporter permease [Brevibacillus]|uniref:carbohydrate ABC transporter permease n=1 Tax=Brevibacillus TaxID=55080 RepID=UPI0006894849|nr:sugar ABC transporter permease [Brevibacillus borstelensis]KKX55464.1 ABC transporter permease [Brevibacillus borstelensis cifa_chp40]MED1744159.1 sugar ABC transporter permease [Brevibacillus borstelensis]MED2007752.1 sugar ABC transporter permease [Brevibacillus borstelensis]